MSNTTRKTYCWNNVDGSWVSSTSDDGVPSPNDFGPGNRNSAGMSYLAMMRSGTASIDGSPTNITYFLKKSYILRGTDMSVIVICESQTWFNCPKHHYTNRSQFVLCSNFSR